MRPLRSRPGRQRRAFAGSRAPPGAGCQVRAAGGSRRSPRRQGVRPGHPPQTWPLAPDSPPLRVVGKAQPWLRAAPAEGDVSTQGAVFAAGGSDTAGTGCAGGTRGSDRGKADDSGRCAWAAGFRP
jgi:hypothetical protein